MRLFCFHCLQGLDLACVNGVGLAQAEQSGPFIIILWRKDTVNQRDNLPANKLQREEQRERETEIREAGKQIEN